jgi:hypothetical protein
VCVNIFSLTKARASVIIMFLYSFNNNNNNNNNNRLQVLNKEMNEYNVCPAQSSCQHISLGAIIFTDVLLGYCVTCPGEYS